MLSGMSFAMLAAVINKSFAVLVIVQHDSKKTFSFLGSAIHLRSVKGLERRESRLFHEAPLSHVSLLSSLHPQSAQETIQDCR